MEANALISIITPTVRPNALNVMARSLKRQDFEGFEWIIVSPEEIHSEIRDKLSGYEYNLIAEPPKNDGDFYCLNKAWNKAFAKAKGELFISYQDNIWIPPDTLSKLWTHYQVNPKALVATVGHQYEYLDEWGRPQNMVWQDPRARSDFGSFYEVAPSEIEFSFCSVPRQAVYDVGGVDEVYDTCPAVGEKEMCYRMARLGYKFFIDQSIEYKAIRHGRLKPDWDEKYHSVTTPLFIKHMSELESGTRLLNVGCVEKYKGK